METEHKNAQDSVRGLQKHNEQLSQRCKDEVNNKLKEQEKRKQAEEKLKIFGGKFSLLFDRYKEDKEEMRKMEVEIKTKTEVIRFLERKLAEGSPGAGPGSCSGSDALSLSNVLPVSATSKPSLGGIGGGRTAPGGGGGGGQRKGGERDGSAARGASVAVRFPLHTKQLSADEMRGVLQRRRWNGRVGGLEPSLAWPKKA